MADVSQIREHFEVVGSVGGHVGTVDSVDGDRIKLTRNDSEDGEHHFIAAGLVESVDGDQVRLSVSAEEATSQGQGEGGSKSASM